MSLGGEVIDFIGELELTGGDRDGETFTCLPWERRFIRGTFVKGRSESGLSLARGNGKSAVVAAIATAAVDPRGPLHRRRGEVIVVASSYQQARIVFRDVKAFLQARHDIDDKKVWKHQDSISVSAVEYKATGATVRCIGSDPRRAHGLRAVLYLADEPAQWPPGTSDRMIAALRTGLGKVPGSRLVALGTRPDTDSHWFARLLQNAPYAQVHAATEDDNPFTLQTWRKANPSIDHLPSLKERIRTEAKEAKADPSLLPAFESLRLNMGTSDTERAVVVDAATWRRAEAAADAEDAGPYALGIDLGTSAAMSAAAAYWPRTGRLAAVAMFPSMPSLQARGIADNVGTLYQRMEARGELLVVPGRTVPVDALLREVLARWGTPGAIVADRWREAELRDALDAAQFPLTKLVVRGMGFMDGGEDVRMFRRAILNGNVKPNVSLLLRSAFAEARTVSDTAGNQKLAKDTQGGRRASARDDAAAAAILAVAEGVRRGSAPPKRPYRAIVL